MATPTARRSASYAPYVHPLFLLFTHTHHSHRDGPDGAADDPGAF